MERALAIRYNGRRIVLFLVNITAVLTILGSQEIQGILNGFFETIRGGSREEVIELLHSLFLNEYLLQILDDLVPQIAEDLPDDDRISAVGIVSFLFAFITYFIYLMRQRRRHRGGSSSGTKNRDVCVDELCATVPDEYHAFITTVIDLIEHLQMNPIRSPSEFLTILRKMSVKTPHVSGKRRANSRSVRPRPSSSTRAKHRRLTPRHRR
jgi:hypothetical protein